MSLYIYNGLIFRQANTTVITLTWLQVDVTNTFTAPLEPDMCNRSTMPDPSIWQINPRPSASGIVIDTVVFNCNNRDNLISAEN